MLAALPLLRGLHLLCMVSLLGALTARCVVAPRFDAAPAGVLRLARASLLLAAPTLLLWLLFQSATFADEPSLDGAFAVLPIVVLHSRFGHVLALRFLLLIAAWPLIGRGLAACCVAILLAAVALALQAALGHAGAAGGGVGAGLLASESLHLIAAGAWLGGLLPLLIMTLRLPRAEAAEAARRFTAVGLPAVLVLIATALVQGEAFVGGLPGLFGTAYGHVVLVKLALFAVLLALALVNRFVLTARFEAGRASRVALAGAIGIETAVGIAVVMAASILASQEPGIHAAPVWPFALRPSTAALADPDIRQDVMLALGVGGAGLLVLLVGFAWRRWRLPLLVLGLAAVAYAAPHLRPLLVEAYPTSYLQSPTGFAVGSIVRGAGVFAANCAGCHGPAGRGDGKQPGALSVPPADLTASHLWEDSDGELFWWLTHGMDNPEGGLSMPGFAAALTEDDRWAVIDFIRANNAGITLRETGAWPVPVPAPDMPLICADGTETDMRSLRGRIVQVIAGPPALVAAPRPIDPTAGFALATVRLMPSGGTDRIAEGCLAATPEAWPAYAILTGVATGALAGAVILVDPSGWLRSVIRTDGDTATSSLITPLLSEMIRHPIGEPTGEAHAHH